MGEFGDTPDNELPSLVTDALAPKGGEVNEPLNEHENLVHETRVLKDKLAAKRRGTAQENDQFKTDMYGSAYYLANALDFVLDATVDVSKIDPETHLAENSDNVTQDMFINSIKRALNHLGMKGDAVKDVLINKDDR